MATIQVIFVLDIKIQLLKPITPLWPICTAWKSPLAERIKQGYKFSLINISFIRKKLFHCSLLPLSPTARPSHVHTTVTRTRRWWGKVGYKLRARTMQARGRERAFGGTFMFATWNMVKENNWGSWTWQQFLPWAGIKVSGLGDRVAWASSYPGGKLPEDPYWTTSYASGSETLGSAETLF